MDEELAGRAGLIMSRLDAALSQPFVTLVAFLNANDGARPASRHAFGSTEYLRDLAVKFVGARAPREPKYPATVPDDLVAVIVEAYFGVAADMVARACDHHRMAMGAENIIGDLLERYIAQALEPKGWVWCSGSSVRDIDFVFSEGEGDWLALQVKNRDNSENNASKRVRQGTTIRHWFRTFSRKPGDNWAKFPFNEGNELSEAGFHQFVRAYLNGLTPLAR